METQPVNPLQDESVINPSVDQTTVQPTIASNQVSILKKKTILLSVVIGVCIIVPSIYFIITRTSSVSKKSDVRSEDININENVQNTYVATTSFQLESNQNMNIVLLLDPNEYNQEKSSTTLITAEDIKNFYFISPDFNFGEYRLQTVTSNDGLGDTLLKNGKTDMLFCNYRNNCRQDPNAKKATLSISNITAIDGASHFFSLLTISFEDGTVYQYFTVANAFLWSNGRKIVQVNSFVDLNTGSSKELFAGTKVFDDNTVSILLKKDSGLERVRSFAFEEDRTSPHRLNFQEVTTDKSQFIKKINGVSFTYPTVFGFNNSNGWSLLDKGAEASLQKSPVYSPDVCGLEPTFADTNTEFILSPKQLQASTTDHSLQARFSFHKIASSTIYLTQSQFGYIPVDQRKIERTINIGEYTKSIVSQQKIAGHKVVLEEINGITVRHILPFKAPRPCEEKEQEQYQLVKDGYILNLIFSKSISEQNTENEKQQFINAVTSSFKVD